MRIVEVDPADASHVLGNLHWGEQGIVVLPESIGDLTVDGSLDLSSNKLESLPESFGSLTVSRSLYLNSNQLISLPESFGSLTVRGSLYLYIIQLESLPEWFGSLTVGGDRYLNDNPVVESRNKNSFPGFRSPLRREGALHGEPRYSRDGLFENEEL